MSTDYVRGHFHGMAFAIFAIGGRLASLDEQTQAEVSLILDDYLALVVEHIERLEGKSREGLAVTA